MYDEIRDFNDIEAFREREIEAHNEIMRREFNSGKKLYLVTFMFKPIRAGGSKRLEIMLDNIRRVEARLVTEVVRCPKSAKGRELRPIIIGAPDRGLNRGAPGLAATNNGWHYHCIFAIPEYSRLKTGLVKHFRLKQTVYLKLAGRVRKIHVERIWETPSNASGYSFKQSKQQNLRDYFI